MRFCLVSFTFVFLFLGVNCLIVPDEIPTILSVIYSNIPILKKGTDSRVGWGFRLGNHADFQVLVELGPQKYTQPLANQEDTGGANKRNTINNLSNTLYAQRQKDKKEQISNTEGGQWLKSWSQNAQNQEDKEVILSEGVRPGIAIGEIDAKSVIPDDTTVSLTKLYKTSPDKKHMKGRINNDPAIILSSLYKEQQKKDETASSENESVTTK